MTSISRITIFVWAVLLLIPGLANVVRAQSPPSVLLVSFDGFRHDYIDKHDLKNFKAFRAAGVSAEGLVPCYPSVTFPNHYSIVTGMRPSTHGLVDNTFYDSVLDLTYSTSNRKIVGDARFYGGTPLWTLAKNAGMKTASYFWVGSEVEDESHRPDVSFLYDANVPFKTRVDSVLRWLNMNDTQRPRLITLYFSEPDHISHNTGPNSPETHAILLKMDSVLGYLTDGIKKVKTPVNTIVVSDHGMTELKMENNTFVFTDELYDIKSPKVKTVVSSSLAHLYIEDKSTLDSMYTLLKQKENHYKVYRKNELPKHLNYNHYRVGDLVMIADHPFYLKYKGRAAYISSQKVSHIGVHGFDPSLVSDMRGIFLAQGPQVKKGVKLGLVNNIDVYPFVAKILGLTAPKIDGDGRVLEKIYVAR